MRDKTHADQNERWAEYVKNNPTAWKKHHSDFINAQYDKFSRFINLLSKTKVGQQKIVKLYGIKNLGGYKKLLNRL